MIARLFAFLLIPGCIYAAEMKTVDGATVEGEVVRIVPATVEIKTQYGTSAIPLASLTPSSQTQALGKLSDAEKISKMKGALDEASELLKKFDPEEVGRLRHINELQEKLIENLKGQLGRLEGKGSEPVSMSTGVPDNVVAALKSDAASKHPGDPSTQLYVVRKNIAAYLKLLEIPDSPAKRKAAQDHPYDFSTQLYVVTSASKAQSELSGVR